MKASIAAELLKACQYADQIAEVLACMSGMTAEGRRAIKLGEKLHARMILAIAKATPKPLQSAVWARGGTKWLE